MEMKIPKEGFRQLAAIKGVVALLALGASLDKGGMSRFRNRG
jgi:hypothetical protein